MREHPYNKREPVPPGTKILIVGTCPPPRFENFIANSNNNNGEFNFYYGSSNNQLWSEIIPEIFNEEFPKGSRSRWRDFLREKRIWMRDILETYTRENNDADDRRLGPQSFIDMREVFERNRDIDTLIFTGCHAEKWTRDRMIAQDLIAYQDWRIQGKMPRLCDLRLNGNKRRVSVCTLPSPTPSSDRRYKLDSKIEMYSKAFRDAGCVG